MPRRRPAGIKARSIWVTTSSWPGARPAWAHYHRDDGRRPVRASRGQPVAEDDAERGRSLAEGEELLRAGSVGHNHLRFHRHAIEASLNAGAWDEVERYAQALEDYTRPEPLPWADFWIAWGRALAVHGRDPASAPAAEHIKGVLEEARRIGL